MNISIYNNKNIELLRDLPSEPGVYQFLDKKRKPLYIGKAKNIKKRLSSYLNLNTNKFDKVKRLLSTSYYLNLTLTNSELEALLLEQHLIKEEKPKFNIQFKDDKGYPWIKLDLSHDFPSANSFLGKKDSKSKYFGPYPSSYSVKEALKLIQRTFKIRNCSNTTYKNRTRPCLQYEIGRCSAPCVNKISKAQYLEEVRSTDLLLSGQSVDLISNFYDRMDHYSKTKEYELAAIYRNKISALRDLQRSQSISGYTKQRDSISICSVRGKTRVGITHVNEGWVVGHENFIPDDRLLEDNLMESFIKSHYFKINPCPPFIITEEHIENKSLLEDALSDFHGLKVKIITRPTKKDKGLLDICRSNTLYAVGRLNQGNDSSQALISLTKELNIPKSLNIVESYDISHHSGSAAVAGCVIFSTKGKLKEKYRLFDISKSNSGNDISSMLEVIERRFTNKNLNLDQPDLIIIDGGKTHLSQVVKKLNQLGKNEICVISISKGIRRKPVMDSIHLMDGSTKKIQKGSLSHLFIQEIRDEAHRFCLSNQKKKTSKNLIGSALDEIKGIGPKKKKLLLRHFGTVDQIKRAGVEDLTNVPGLGKIAAISLHDRLQ